MGLHWVEQAALEAQANIVAATTARASTAAATNEAEVLEQQDRPHCRDEDGVAGSRISQRQAAVETFPSWTSDDASECDRHWSHSDELDQLVRGVLHYHARSNTQCSASKVDGSSAEPVAVATGVTEWLRMQFTAGALCWGRCADYRCVQRRHGRTLLMECARAGASEALAALLDPHTLPDQPRATPDKVRPRPLPVNTASEEGYTALHYASYNGHIAAVHALLVAGADQRLRNSKGETPHASAEAAGHNHVVDILHAWANASAPPLEEGEVVERTTLGSAIEPGVHESSSTVEDAQPIPDARSWVAKQRVPASWLLVELSGARDVVAGAVVALKKQHADETAEMVVGRSRSQDLVLKDIEVSTRHAKLGLGGAFAQYICLVFMMTSD